MSIRIGLSGWSYDTWSGSYYPSDLPRERWLEYVSRDFSTVEINRSFYSLLRPDIYETWRSIVPNDFRFAVKGSRYITHMKSLRDVDIPLANFFASGVLELGDKLDTCLWQLPHQRKIAPELVASFVGKLPRTLSEAGELARAHDQRVTEFQPSDLSPAPLRHAIELRRLDVLDATVMTALRSHNAAIALSHSSRWPLIQETTADFSYIRLHGPHQLYDSEYGAKALEAWSERVSDLAAFGDVLVYFDNDGHAYAPNDARSLARLVTT